MQSNFNDQRAHYSPERIDSFERQGSLSSAVQNHAVKAKPNKHVPVVCALW